MGARVLIVGPIALAVLFVAAFALAPLAALAAETLSGPDGLGAVARGFLCDPADRARLAHSLWLGLGATAVGCVLGGGHAFVTCRTDVPFARVLGPLGVAPLALPPIVVAMGFADFVDASGFASCAILLGVCYAPFVAVLTARGLRATDGRLYEAALLARGRGAAERLLLRLALPELLAGCLFVFLFVLAEHGVPEFLTVKGKTWHTYAEGVFASWTRRATGASHEAIVSPLVASLPLCAVLAVALVLALRLRARTTLRGDAVPLPRRAFGPRLRFCALALPLVYLTAGVAVPVVVMARWAAGSTDAGNALSFARARDSARLALTEAGPDLVYTIGVAAAATAIGLCVAVPLARVAARRWRAALHLSVVPLLVPAVLLGIGLVHVYNSPALGPVYARLGDFYDSAWIVAAAYAARFLPFGVLTLSHAQQRVPRALEEAALLGGRGPLARALRIHAPLGLPAACSAACLLYVLALRELDLAVVLPAGNGTVVRRLSNVVHFGGEDLGGALALLLLGAAVAVPLVVVLVSGRRLTSLS
jgi:iron(III) transport system permease protein